MLYREIFLMYINLTMIINFVKLYKTNNNNYNNNQIMKKLNQFKIIPNLCKDIIQTINI